MKQHIQANPVTNKFFSHTNYILSLPSGCTSSFVQDVATYFVQTWMKSQLPHVMNIWQNWDKATSDKKQDYFWYLRDALLYDVKTDDFSRGYINPEVLPGFR